MEGIRVNCDPVRDFVQGTTRKTSFYTKRGSLCPEGMNVVEASDAEEAALSLPALEPLAPSPNTGRKGRSR